MLQINVSTLVRHLQRAHADKYQEYKTAYNNSKDKIQNNSLTRKRKFDGSSSQKKMTDFAAISPTMKLAVNLAVYRGAPFSLFNDQSMTRLISAAKKGSGDNSSKVINAENVKSAIRELAREKRKEITNQIKGKVVNLSGDMATCEARSFIGK